MLTIGKDPAVDDRSAAVAPRERRQLVGNRWALAGAIIYLLEWVAIAGWLGALVGINGGGVTTTGAVWTTTRGAVMPTGADTTEAAATEFPPFTLTRAAAGAVRPGNRPTQRGSAMSRG